MNDFFGNESVFKKPAVPSRYQRIQYGNNSAYVHGVVDTSNNSGYTASKLKEKIEILEKAFPQNDCIWESLIKNVDQLCFLKVSEQVLQSNGQPSTFSGGSTCPSVLSQLKSSSEKARSNYAHSTNNARDYLQSQSCQRFNLQNEFSVSTVQGSEQPEYRSSRLHNVFPAPEIQEYEPPDYSRFTRMPNARQTSEIVKYHKSKSQDAASENHVSSCFSQKPDETTCGSRIVRKLNATKNLSKQHGGKVSEEMDLGGTFNLSVPDASNSHFKVPSAASRPTKNKINGSPAKKKSRKDQNVELIVPMISKKQNKNVRAKENHRQPSEAVIISETRSSQKRNDQSVKSTRDVSDQSNISTRSSVRKKDETCEKDHRDLKVLNSEDENDSLAAFFHKKRKVTAKKTSANNTDSVSSASLSHVNNSSIRPSKKRKRRVLPQVVEEESESDKDDLQSEESDVSTLKNASKSTTRKKENVSRKVLQKKPVKPVEVKHIKNNLKSRSKSNKAPSQNLENICSGEPTKKNLVPSSDNLPNQAVDDSFFGEVSSILDNGDVSLLRVDRRNRRDKRISENDASMPFLSPFTPGISRSTSGFSAISTPLSKSMAKNIMGKRIKKPNVVAELKGELKQTRKKRNIKAKPNTVQPVLDGTATTESESEVSDPEGFSDVD